MADSAAIWNLHLVYRLSHIPERNALAAQRDGFAPQSDRFTLQSATFGAKMTLPAAKVTVFGISASDPVRVVHFVSDGPNQPGPSIASGRTSRS